MTREQAVALACRVEDIAVAMDNGGSAETLRKLRDRLVDTLLELFPEPRLIPTIRSPYDASRRKR